MDEALQTLLSEKPELRKKLDLKEFPFTNCCVPQFFECDACDAPGWGPMLKEEVWAVIKPVHPKQSFGTGFLCQQCMERRLGRHLTASDLSLVPMNYLHPLLRSTA